MKTERAGRRASRRLIRVWLALELAFAVAAVAIAFAGSGSISTAAITLFVVLGIVGGVYVRRRRRAQGSNSS